MKGFIEITVGREDKPDSLRIPAIIRGPLAIHPSPRGTNAEITGYSDWAWTVTHLNTGCALRNDLYCYQARCFVRKVLEKYPPETPIWNEDDHSKIKQMEGWKEFSQECRKLLREIGAL